MKPLLILFIFSFSFLYAAPTYPSMFSKLGTPLYKESEQLTQLKSIESLRSPITKYLDKLNTTMQMGFDADKSSEKKVKMSYLKTLRSLQQEHEKIIALSKHALSDAMEHKDKKTFTLIIRSNIPDLFKRESFNEELIDFDKKNNTDKQHRVTNKLASKQNNTQSIPSATNTANMSDKMLYERTKSLLNNYFGQREILQSATDLTKEFLKRDPANPFALILEARLMFLYGYLGGDKYDQKIILEARNILKSVMHQKPNLFDACQSYAASFLLENTNSKFENTKAAIKLCEKIQPNSLKLQLLYARIELEKKDYAKLDDYARYILSNTQETWMVSNVYGLLSRAYWAQKKYDSANDAYLKIIKLSPDSAWALINYSNFLRATKQYDKAISYAKKALSIMDFGMGHYVLSKAYYQKGAHLHWDLKDKVNSRPYFIKSIEQNPKNAYAYFGLGMSYYHTGYYKKNIDDLQKAKQALEQVLRLKPKYERAQKQLNNIKKLLATVANK